jgi:hypothetical protein
VCQLTQQTTPFDATKLSTGQQHRSCRTKLRHIWWLW